MVLDFEDTPLFDWLKKNRLFLLVLFTGIIGLAAYDRFGPALREKGRIESWSLYNSALAGLDLDENLASSMQLVKGDDRVYPWFLFHAATIALRNGNEAALGTLRPELEAIASTSKWKLASNNGPISVAAFLVERIDESGSGVMDWSNPTPTGTSVKIVVTDSLETAYEITVGMYEDAAPLASEAFLAAVESGSLVGETVDSFGGRTIRLNGLGAEESPALECKYGYFHLAGSLSMIPKPGSPGEQELEAVQLSLEDNTFADGTSTVFAHMTEGLEEFRAGVQAAPQDVTYTLTSATIL